MICSTYVRPTEKQKTLQFLEGFASTAVVPNQLSYRTRNLRLQYYHLFLIGTSKITPTSLFLDITPPRPRS